MNAFKLLDGSVHQMFSEE